MIEEYWRALLEFKQSLAVFGDLLQEASGVSRLRHPAKLQQLALAGLPNSESWSKINLSPAYWTPNDT